MQHLRNLWFAQDFPISPTLLQIIPNTAQPGQKNLALTIQGQFTNFVQGTTLASFGAGISVASLTVNSPSSATAVVNIDPASSPGPRDITITTSLEVVALGNGLVIANAGVATLIQVSPDTISAGKMNVSVAISAQSTAFVQGTTTANFGTGISVLSLTVNSPTSATAVLNIDPATATGTHDVSLSTKAVVATMPKGFEATAAVLAPAPIIDPDLLNDADFVNANTSDAAYSLFHIRQGIVQNWIQTLQGLRDGIGCRARKRP